MSEVKVVILGDGGVGKSCLTMQLYSHRFVDEWDPTLEDSFRMQIEVDGGTYLLDFLDTAGQDEYSAMREQYFRTADAFLIMYSITSRQSFDEVMKFYESCLRMKDTDYVCGVLVGNKVDLENEREVTCEEGKELADKMGFSFFETSAKTRINVVESFHECVRVSEFILFDRQINYLESRKKKLKLWQFAKKINIEKELEELNKKKPYVDIIRRKWKLKRELARIPEFLTPPTVRISPSSFSSNLKSMINDKSTSDQTLMVNEIPIYIHKIMIACRCSSFSQYLGTNSQVIISDISYPGLTLFLEYIYTGSLSKAAEIRIDFTELIKLAKRFNLEHLIKLCENEQIQKESFIKLQEDMKNLLKKSNSHDAKIRVISSDGKSEKIFSVHHQILSARSSWFASFFSHNWKESVEKEIVIRDFELDSFEALLEYLYIDDISDEHGADMLLDLIRFADQINLLRLKELCESKLHSLLHVDTVLQLYQFCLDHGASQLAQCCSHLISLPSEFPKLEEKNEFKSLDATLQTKLKKDYDDKYEIQTKRKSLVKQIEECEKQLQV